jgi:hypothetical protein
MAKSAKNRVNPSRTTLLTTFLDLPDRSFIKRGYLTQNPFRRLIPARNAVALRLRAGQAPELRNSGLRQSLRRIEAILSSSMKSIEQTAVTH